MEKFNMQNKKTAVGFTVTALFALFCFAALTVAAAPRPASTPAIDDFQTERSGGVVIVRPRLGGQILGYDIERNGTEGLLSEFVSLSNGNSNVATETFDQKTGKILKVVVKKTNTQDDYVTQGIWGNIGLVMFEHSLSLFHVERSFHTMNPLDS